MSLWQRLALLATKSTEPRYQDRAKDRRGRMWGRGLGPTVDLLEDRTLLSNATLTTLAVSAGTLTYGQAEVLTATVTTNPVSSITPSGGTVSFMEGPTTLDTENLTAGTAIFSTTRLSAGLHVLTAVYSGSAAFKGSSTPIAATSIIMTIAGGGNGNGGLATAAALNGPLGVAVDAFGNIFIADSTNNVIREVSAATGAITTVAGDGSYGYTGDGGPATDAALDYPTAVALDSSGNLFIVDSLNDVIREVSDGVINTIAGNGTYGYSGDGQPATDAELSSPATVTVDSFGNIYIADFGNNVIREVSGGVIHTVAGNGMAGYTGDGLQATDAELSGPTGVAVDSSGNIYIADSGNNVIREVSGGEINTVAGNGTAGYSGDGMQATAAELSSPYGVTVDSSGQHLYIADTGNNVIREVSSGVISTIAGGGSPSSGIGDGGPATDAVLSNPFTAAVDSSGNLFIADTGNNVIREVAGGMISTVAGNGFVTYSGDGGQATNAQLDYPSSVAVDSLGNVYIADTFNNVVREVSAATGVITTVAGNGTSGYSGDGMQATDAELNQPTGVAVDSAGDIFIADRGNNVIREVTDGVINTVAGDGTAGYAGDGMQATSAELDAPVAVALDASGNLYISDSGNNVIREVSLGTITTIAGDGTAGYSGDGMPATDAELDGPAGIAVDRFGNVYIADAGNDVIREVDAGSADISSIAGGGSPISGNGDGGPATLAELFNPSGVAVDSAGNLYIADAGDSAIREVTLGMISTFAGDGSSGYSGDGGPPSGALLNFPAGVAVDASDNIYIADAGNNVIRQVLVNQAGAQSVTITPAPLTITAADQSKAYGSTITFAGTEFTDTGLENGDTVTSATLASTGAAAAAAVAGSPYAITVSAALGTGLSNYTITYVSGSLTVNKYAFSYTIGNDSQTYGSPANLATGLVGSIDTGVNGETLHIAYSSTGDTATAHAGNYPINGALSNGTGLVSDYAVTLVPGMLTVNKKAFTSAIANDSETYSSPANLATDLVATINTGVNGQNLAIAYSSAGDTAAAHVGNYSITGAISDGTGLASDYAVTLNPGTLTVNKKAVTLIIANDSQTYGAAANLATDLGTTINTGVNGQNFAIAYSSTGDTGAAHVDTYPITGALSSGTGLTSDYTVTLNPGTLTVNKRALTVTADSATKVYGAALPALTDQITGFVNGDTAIGVVNGKASLTTTATASSAAGVYPIQVAAGTMSATDYDFPAANFTGANLTVTKAPLTITAVSESMVAGQAVPPLTANYSGFVNGDTPASLTTPPTIATIATSASPAGSYPITVTGAASPNYTISFGDGTLTVILAPATVERVSIQKVSIRKHKTAKAIVLQFSEALNSVDAQIVSAYSVVTVPHKKKQRSQRVAISTATYNAQAFTVTLLTRKTLSLNTPLQLTITAAALLDALGRRLDGNFSGQPGANYVATISKSGVSVNSSGTRP